MEMTSFYVTSHRWMDAGRGWDRRTGVGPRTRDAALALDAFGDKRNKRVNKNKRFITSETCTINAAAAVTGTA